MAGQVHAKGCQIPQCPVPRCRDLKELKRRASEKQDMHRRQAFKQYRHAAARCAHMRSAPCLHCLRPGTASRARDAGAWRVCRRLPGALLLLCITQQRDDCSGALAAAGSKRHWKPGVGDIEAHRRLLAGKFGMVKGGEGRWGPLVVRRICCRGLQPVGPSGSLWQ